MAKTDEQSKHWTQIRMTRLYSDGDVPVQVGVYTCAPIQSGCTITFHHLTIEAKK